MEPKTVWLAYNTDGDIELSCDDADTALTNLLDNYGALQGTKVIEIKLTLPDIKPLKVEATIPDTDGPVNVTVS